MKDKKRVLLVEDSNVLMRTYAKVLASVGYEVEAVSNLKDAINNIEDNTYHVALIDIQLDEDDENNRDGLRVIERIHSLQEGTAIVILSGLDALDVAVEAYERFGLHKYLEKKKFNTPDQITTAVKNAFEASRIRELGSFKSITDLLSGGRSTQHWENECLRALKPSGGMRGLNQVLTEFCKPYTPLLPKKELSPPMQIVADKEIAYGEFWSKAFGKALLLSLHSKDSTGRPSMVDQFGPVELIRNYEKANVVGSVFSLPKATRHKFVERV